MGKAMVHNAHVSLAGENQFLAAKKSKASMAMRNQWKQSL